MSYCKDCEIKNKCHFYENDDDECVYDILVELREESKKSIDK